jgi:predicted  nucleic acid-binding Zn-ribbon protein
MDLDRLQRDTTAIGETKQVQDYKNTHKQLQTELERLEAHYRQEEVKWKASMTETTDKIQECRKQKQALVESMREQYNFCRTNICCSALSAETIPLPKYTSSCWACIDEQRS